MSYQKLIEIQMNSIRHCFMILSFVFCEGINGIITTNPLPDDKQIITNPPDDL